MLRLAKTVLRHGHHHLTKFIHKLDVDPAAKLVLISNVYDIKYFKNSNKWAVTLQNKPNTPNSSTSKISTSNPNLTPSNNNTPTTFHYHIYKGPTIDFKFDKHNKFLGLGPVDLSSKIYTQSQLLLELKKPENSGFKNWKFCSFGLIHRKPILNFESNLLPEHDTLALPSKFDLDEFGFKSKASQTDLQLDIIKHDSS